MKRLILAGLLLSTALTGCGLRQALITSGNPYSIGCGRSAPLPPCSQPDQSANTESYAHHEENAFVAVREQPLSTFAVDVDTASYANVRRFLNDDTLPPPDAVRVEELINYFPYAYAPPAGSEPFSVHLEVADCPWNLKHRLVRVGLKGKEFAAGQRPHSNMVFLVDVSGSMNEPNKLPLVKSALKLLVEKLTEDDRVALVVYAGSAGLVLPSTSGDKKEKIIQALEKLEAGGGTNGGEGIRLAYRTAVENLKASGNNRVILCTDGDFNVGVTNHEDLVSLVRKHAKSNVFLTVLGFGMGNLKDATMENLADKGNGQYAYVDSLAEARKLLVEQAGGTLATIAKDVKIQVEFNPAQASAYRLIGYENRLLQARDFNDDAKDAGEIGAGHTVTALYEIVPAGMSADTPSVDPLRYQLPGGASPASQGGELLTLKIRYKDPTGETSSLLQFPLRDGGQSLDTASTEFRFAAAVAGFGMLLRDSPHKGNCTYGSVLHLAEANKAEDKGGYRTEFLELVRKARKLQEESMSRRSSVPTDR